MNDVEAVHIGDAFEELVGILFDQVGVDGSLLQYFKQVLFDVLADKIYFAFLPEGFLQLYDVVMGQCLEYFDLSEDDPFVLFVAIVFFKFLDGYQIAILLVASFEHHSVFALSYLVQNFVFIHLKIILKKRIATHYSHLHFNLFFYFRERAQTIHHLLFTQFGSINAKKTD